MTSLMSTFFAFFDIMWHRTKAYMTCFLLTSVKFVQSKSGQHSDVYFAAINPSDYSLHYFSRITGTLSDCPQVLTME